MLTYNGNGKELYDKIKTSCNVVCGDRSFSQRSACAEGCAHTQACRTRDTAAVFHAPVGCDAGVMQYVLAIKGAIIARNAKPYGVNTICSNIQEKDTIFGAADKLKLALREADKRFHPRATYITTSCASGIIGEDIESIAGEMEEELGYPVIPIYCEGFRSKIWSTGFDAAFHGILRKLVRPPQKKQEDLVNVFNFAGSDAFSPLLNRMGLRVNYLVALSSIEEMTAMSEAACST
jgi:nitrogenase molybdenum-iron protein alpha chain